MLRRVCSVVYVSVAARSNATQLLRYANACGLRSSIYATQICYATDGRATAYPTMAQPPIDLDKPRWHQNTYLGRAKHFILLTNPLNIFASDRQLDDAKKVVDEYRKTKQMPPGYDADRLWATKYLYDSAFHPETGEKVFKLGRLCAQVPMNTLITAGMITFYKTNPALIFWQWLNQSYNAIVNYTNRSGDVPITTKQVLASYGAACGSAISTALFLKSRVKNPLYARMVPFAAVCAANFINIPMVRSNELMNGTPVFAPEGQRVGESKVAARNGTMFVCVSRVAMTIPGLTLVPIIANAAVKRGLFCHYPLAVIPFQLTLAGLCVTSATPLCCAFFDQKQTMSLDDIEKNLKEVMTKVAPKATTVYFNKGL